MSSRVTTEAACKSLGVSRSPVFSHLSVAGSYFNTSDKELLLLLSTPPDNTICTMHSTYTIYESFVAEYSAVRRFTPGPSVRP